MLVDKNFTPKIADFGLSQVKRSIKVGPRCRGDEHLCWTHIRTHACRQARDSSAGASRSNRLSINGEETYGAPALRNRLEHGCSFAFYAPHSGVTGTPEWMAPEVMEGSLRPPRRCRGLGRGN